MGSLISVTYQTECKCGYETGYGPEWWIDLKFWLHVLAAHKLLRRSA